VGPLVTQTDRSLRPVEDQGRPEVAVASGIEVGLQGQAEDLPTPPLGLHLHLAQAEAGGGGPCQEALQLAERLQPALRALAAAHEREV